MIQIWNPYAIELKPKINKIPSNSTFFLKDSYIFTKEAGSTIPTILTHTHKQKHLCTIWLALLFYLFCFLSLCPYCTHIKDTRKNFGRL